MRIPNSPHIYYQSGDVVVQRMRCGWFRDVLVDTPRRHNGWPGFVGWVVEETPDGDLLTKGRVWGYDSQIVRNLGPTVHNEDYDRVYMYCH